MKAVYVLIIDHNYGTDAWAFSTEDKAKEHVEKYARAYWEEVADEGEEFVSTEEYFERKYQDWFAIRKSPIDEAGDY